MKLTRYGLANIIGYLLIIAAVAMLAIQAHRIGRAEIDPHAECPMHRCSL